ncbi:helix-turn-helix domain-containing protein [Sutcliffiella halmapala]|uniref:helix-turn-helix domain-containing protein n=1 Tax=Sutcliffiella halmapala TaxID=79882 RepID=UPI000995D4D1|nr:helix-turn-helix transcriptional regulator [Sutcliffiella halmapala]
MLKSIISRNIKYLREQRGWTQLDLADELNRVRGTISKWETGKETPDIETLIHICKIFEVSIDYLTGNHYEQEEYVKEFNRLYHLQEQDEELMEIVDYLKQNPKFKSSLHTYTKLNSEERKTLGEVLRLLVKGKA